jgi:hypothetical protein
LTEAQQGQDWQGALRLVDQLSALPSDAVDSTTLAKTKRLLLVQQALELLEQDNRAAATALAGDELRDSSLLPPPSADALFSRWEVTVTVSPVQQQLEIVGKPVAERSIDAATAFASLTALWQSIAVRSERLGIVVETPLLSVDGQTGAEPQRGDEVRILLKAPATTSFAELATVLPSRADWALLRTLLQQLQPSVEEKTVWLNRRWTITQALDLKAAGEQWQAMAATLERQAAQYEGESAAFDTTDAIGAENALRARVQAANYRSAAHEWQWLTRDSWIAVHFTGEPEAQTRTWLLTADTPAQQLALVVQPSSVMGVMSMAALALVGLFLLTTVLWWLL